MSASLTITHSHEEGTLIVGTSRGDGTAEILKGQGWRWGRSISSWFIPMSRDRLPKTYVIERTANALRDAGFEVTLEVDQGFRATADVEAGKIERQANRVEALETKAERQGMVAEELDKRGSEMAAAIPFGQPILIGHSSEQRDRRYREKIHNTLTRAAEAGDKHRQTAERAGTAARTTDRRYKPITVANRIERMQAELRDRKRRLEGEIGGAYAERLTTEIAAIEDQLNFWQGVREDQITAGIATNYGPDTIDKGDKVKVRGSWSVVARVNKKSVSVETGYSWTNTVPYAEIQDVRKEDS